MSVQFQCSLGQINGGVPVQAPSQLLRRHLTSLTHYGKLQPAGFFALHGSWAHINPALAIDPGLIYNNSPADYITHLYILGYTSSESPRSLFRTPATYHDILKMTWYFSLNYPSTSVARRRATKGVSNANGQGESTWETVQGVRSPLSVTWTE